MSTEPVGDDKYGEIRSDWLRLEAPLLRMSVVDGPLSDRNLAYHAIRPFKLHFEFDTMFIDGIRSDPNGYNGPIFGIVLAEMRRQEQKPSEELSIEISGFLYGLIVKAIDQTNLVFERVGIFYGPLMPEEPGPWYPDLKRKYDKRSHRECLDSEGSLKLTRVSVMLI
jgi:hypothetical protein